MKKTVLLLFVVLLIPFLTLAQTQQLENPGFEFWEDAGTVLDEPVDWSSIKTSDNQFFADAAPVVWGKSDDAHSGNYSVHIFNVYISLVGTTVSGTIFNGRAHPSIDPTEGYTYTDPDDPQWNTPFNSRPDSLVGWFKTNPMDGDSAGIRAIIHFDEGTIPPFDTEDNWIAEANHSFPGHTINTWTRFSVPFEYYSEDPSTHILINIRSGNGLDAIEDGELWIDDLELIYNDPGSIDDLSNDHTIIYYKDGYLNLKVSSPDFLNSATLYLHDMGGKKILEQRITSDRVSLESTMVEGIYIAKIVGKSKVITQKIYIH